MKKKMTACVLLVLLLTCVSACSKNTSESGNSYKVYYINKERTGVVSEIYITNTPTEDKETLLKELMGRLSGTSDKPEYLPPLSGAFQEYTLNMGQMNLDFGAAYKNIDPIEEVLRRAAVVRTLTQIDGIDTITFSVQKEGLTDAVGVPVGAMGADSFIDNAGTTINPYAEADFKLYFANQAGNRLMEVHRKVIYNSNVSMERQVVEELVKGPQNSGYAENEEGYPTINPAVKIIGVTLKDRVCYVNLSEEFLTPVYDVTSQTVLYSIVNSLVELPGVNRVQISIDGKTDITYRESISLTTVFERNLDVVDVIK